MNQLYTTQHQPLGSENFKMNAATLKAIEARRKILLQIKEELIDRLQLDFKAEDIDDDTFLFGGGLSLDSIDAMEIVIALQSSFGVMLPEGDIASLRTINTLADFVLSEQEQHEENVLIS